MDVIHNYTEYDPEGLFSVNKHCSYIIFSGVLAIAYLVATNTIAQSEIPNGDLKDLYNPLASWNTHGQASVVQDLRDASNIPTGFGYSVSTLVSSGI